MLFYYNFTKYLELLLCLLIKDYIYLVHFIRARTLWLAVWMCWRKLERRRLMPSMPQTLDWRKLATSCWTVGTNPTCRPSYVRRRSRRKLALSRRKKMKRPGRHTLVLCLTIFKVCVIQCFITCIVFCITTSNYEFCWLFLFCILFYIHLLCTSKKFRSTQF